MKLSPLFWPIKMQGDTIYILDETLLPQRLSYIKAKNCREACRAIKDMKTRAVGQVLLVLYTLLLVARQNKNKKGLVKRLEKVAASLNATRPTLSFRFLTEMVLGWVKAGAPLEKNIPGFLEMLKAKRIKQAESASKLLKDNDVLLTHCNVSGQLPLVAEFCRRQGKRISFFVTETRPYLQGSRLTAWELHNSGVGTTLITDSMVAQVMHEKKVNKVLIGADHLAKNGDFANKVGSYQIALLAKYFKIPLYVLCPPTSKARTGRDIKIEIRPDKEMLEFCGKPIAPKGVKGYYPAFDVTPAKFVSKHIYLEI